MHRTESKDFIADKEALKNWQIFFKIPKYDLKNSLEIYHELRAHLREYFEKENIHELNLFLKNFEFKKQIVKKKNYATIANDLLSHSRDSIIESVINDFETLVTNNDKTRIKRCANPNCSHLFLDTSKNNSRAWCNMKTCGNIMKARAFLKRKKKNPDT